MNGLNNSAKKVIYPELMTVAREMRAQPTKTENILWKCISSKKLGIRFRRQHVIDRFVVDFCCLRLKLIVEVDGEIHGTQRMRDAERDIILTGLGYRVLRFTNDQVTKHADYVTGIILLETENLAKARQTKRRL